MPGVVRISHGDEVLIFLPAHFVCANRIGVFNDLILDRVTVGRNHRGMQTEWLAGEYRISGREMGCVAIERQLSEIGQPPIRVFLPHDGVTVAEPSTTRQPSVAADPSATITR